MEIIQDSEAEELKKIQGFEFLDYFPTSLRRIQSWRAFEILHPWLRKPLIALTAAAFWCLLGIAAFVVFFVGSLVFVVYKIIPVGAVVLPAFLWLLPDTDGEYYESQIFSLPVLGRHITFMSASVILFFNLYYLHNYIRYILQTRALKKDPASNANESLLVYIDQLPAVPRIAARIILDIMFNTCLGILCCDLIIVCYFPFFVTRYIPWYILLVMISFLLFLIITFRRRTKSSSMFTDHDFVKRPPV